MNLRPLLIAAAVLAFSLPAFAMEIPVAGTVQDLHKMPGGLYTLDSSHAHALFFINHMGFSEYTGGFNDISGNMTFKPDDLANSKLDVTIKVDSVNVQSELLAENLKGTEFFDAEKYPEITFTATKLVAQTGKHGKMTGLLTMHGVTRPITLDVHFMGGGVMPLNNTMTMGFVATGKLKRSDFGITDYLPGLGDDVLLDISAEFDKADTSPRERP